MTFIKSNFAFLPKSIIFLDEIKGIKLCDPLRVVEGTKNTISDVHCTKGSIFVKNWIMY